VVVVPARTVKINVKNIPRLIFLWLPVILWAAFIFYGSSLPGDEIPKIDVPLADKLYHFAEYLILGFLLMKALINSEINIDLAKLTVLSIIIAAVYAASDEWHQFYVSQRTPDIIDLIVDLTGICAGVFLYRKRGASCPK